VPGGWVEGGARVFGADAAGEQFGLFGAGPEYTVGVEEEFMLVDPQTLALVPAGPTLLTATSDPDHIKAEIRQCMLEISSAPCRTTRELYRELRDLRSRVQRAAAARGCSVAGGGVHPFSAPEVQPVTDTQRYRDVIVESGYPGRWSLVLGTHVHVALASADKALAVTEALLEDLPTLVALSASSPVWGGLDTGMASMRLALWASVPRSGLPPRFSAFADYLHCLEVLHESGAVPDASHVWWDVRSQQRLGTLEVRVMDGQPCLRDTVALAGLVQSLVRHHGRAWDAGESVEPQRFLVSENRWQAVWKGMGATFARADGTTVTAHQAVDELLDRVAEDADALDTRWALEHVSALAAHGGPAAWERAVFAQVRDPTALMRDRVARTRLDGDDPADPPVAPGRGRDVDASGPARIVDLTAESPIIPPV
jgi:glutamate---cysteine ligase / carboxylate-amine ligase